MSSFKFVTADIFTTKKFGGNQLAVFPDARGLSDDSMARIAREFNFSETTFVLPPNDAKHTRRVRIFTPGGEIPFAGHPTVGTAFVLATIGEIPLAGAETRIVFEEGVGPVPVTIRSKNGSADFAQLTTAKLPEFGPKPPAASDLARILGLETGDVLTGAFAPEAVSCGLAFLFIPVRDRGVLARARVRLDDFEKVLRGSWTEKVFVFCDDPELPGSHFRARMFAPTISVPEDPATGSACAAFGGYLAKRDSRAEGMLRWVVEQGFEMGRPSILEVEVDKRSGAITAVRVGGNSVLVSKGEFFLA
jgi:trans-2,3-dihydro-3-hydroxyanthranilate isomerase